MLTLGALSFAAPWVLLALAGLPVLWWLLRITPPAPWRLRFPAVRLLLGLVSREETSAKTPWWLILLRVVLATAVILAAAHPVINASNALTGKGPLVMIVDDGWAAGRDWAGRKTVMANLIDQAQRENRSVVVVTTAPDPSGAIPEPQVLGPEQARKYVDGLQPKPWPTDRTRALEPLVEGDRLALQRPADVVWLSDGTGGTEVARWAARLQPFGSLTVYDDSLQRPAMVLHAPVSDGDGLIVSAARSTAAAPAKVWLRALSEDGRLLAREALDFGDGEKTAKARLVLPAEMRNRLSRLELEGEETAGAVVLVDNRWRRRPVGLVSAEGSGDVQPLLSDTYYLERALTPYTELRHGAVSQLLERSIAVIVLVDPGPLAPAAREKLERWMSTGGVVVRFAGPRLADNPKGLLPVQLRAGDRVLGGAMSWERPARLAPFPEGSPFHGLPIPDDVTVRRQVLAQPSLDLPEKTWAELTDGTPLVSAEPRGQGWLVLVHTSANASWSNLALSGLFVEMMRRLVDLSEGVAAGADKRPLQPTDLMDGFGRLGAPAPGALALAGDAFAKTTPGPRHPPGFYGAESLRRAFNLSTVLPDPEGLRNLASSVGRAVYGVAREIDLRPWVLLAALILLLADIVAAMALRGVFRRPAVVATIAAGVMLGGLLTAGGAVAQSNDAFDMEASLHTHLAYVITGDAQLDERSRAGLTGLSNMVNRRTAAELAPPMGVDPETDELAFFPLLYWPWTEAQGLPSRQEAARLDTFMRNGGTIVFDLADEGGTDVGGLRRLADLLDIPPLVPIPTDHVLGRSYYLLQEFPGRWTGGTVWVERAGERVNDGVSSVIVGSNDWAGAWAVDQNQRPLYAVVPGGERQRELAYRFGINLVMYVLTGNYKADQVHLPAILQRLGP